MNVGVGVWGKQMRGCSWGARVFIKPKNFGELGSGWFKLVVGCVWHVIMAVLARDWRLKTDTANVWISIFDFITGPLINSVFGPRSPRHDPGCNLTVMENTIAVQLLFQSSWWPPDLQLGWITIFKLPLFLRLHIFEARKTNIIPKELTAPCNFPRILSLHIRLTINKWQNTPIPY